MFTLTSITLIEVPFHTRYLLWFCLHEASKNRPTGQSGLIITRLQYNCSCDKVTLFCGVIGKRLFINRQWFNQPWTPAGVYFSEEKQTGALEEITPHSPQGPCYSCTSIAWVVPTLAHWSKSDCTHSPTCASACPSTALLS